MTPRRHLADLDLATIVGRLRRHGRPGAREHRGRPRSLPGGLEHDASPSGHRETRRRSSSMTSRRARSSSLAGSTTPTSCTPRPGRWRPPSRSPSRWASSRSRRHDRGADIEPGAGHRPSAAAQLRVPGPAGRARLRDRDLLRGRPGGRGRLLRPVPPAPPWPPAQPGHRRRHRQGHRRRPAHGVRAPDPARGDRPHAPTRARRSRGPTRCSSGNDGPRCSSRPSCARLDLAAGRRADRERGPRAAAARSPGMGRRRA